jgi:RNA recognition motif-containing protein
MAANLYVGNLSYQTTEEALQTLFAEYGEVESVRLITDRYTGRSKGFAFVEMTDDEAAETAIGELNGKSVDDRTIRVEKAKPRRDRDSRQGGRGPRW